ncbi:hypothetical protein NE237_008892 [Protea cynaroides]|uniref:Uncharacterized protein n=1 Tax=Protea cynaroides TaxID=273540 RepID=A0A9Q0KWF6_9MAGN|nr:hypothetical protein NE237_008892 [Protea cynaroides]
MRKDVSDGVAVKTTLEHYHVDSIEHCNQDDGILNVQTPGVVETNVNMDRHHDDGVKSANLEEKIRQLQSENDSFIQREGNLEKKILNLQNEKDYWLQKEVSLEEKIEQLSDEKALLILKANSMKEMIGRLNEENLQLQAQPVSHSFGTLKASSLSPSSTTEMTKQVLQPEDLNAQIEAGHVLVEKLIAENARLVEKVNELSIELDHRSVRAAENVYKSSEMSTSVERMESFETIQMGDRTSNAANIADTGSSAITSIKIEEYPALYEADAPLIGAPFRLISFFC